MLQRHQLILLLLDDVTDKEIHQQIWPIISLLYFISHIRQKTLYPIINYLLSSNFLDHYQAYHFAIASAIEMLNYKNEVEDESWRFDVEDEIVVLEDRELCGRLKPYHQGRKLLALNGFFFFFEI